MPTGNLKHCPICKLDKVGVSGGSVLSLECRRCGKFPITLDAVAILENKERNPKLSAWIRERSDSGAEVKITSFTLDNVALPTYTVSEKQLRLLRAFEKRTRFPGDAIDIMLQFDYPLSQAANEDEFRYLLRSLIDRGLIRGPDGPQDLVSGMQRRRYKFEITADGWDYLDEHARAPVKSDQVFVAMSFSAELKSAWENGIKVALKKAGFRPYRVDADPHIEKIDAKIITEIENSRFLVADVTQQRPGIYFEAGYALGLRRDVFWCVRRDDLENVHFDTRQYNHIVWENEQDLANQLELFVTAIIGRGSATYP